MSIIEIAKALNELAKNKEAIKVGEVETFDTHQFVEAIVHYDTLIVVYRK